MKRTFLIVGLLAVYSPAFAGNEGAHGGNGVKASGRIAMLDLVERGVREGTVSGKADTYCMKAARETLPQEVDDSSIFALCARIAEIRERDSLTGLALVRALAMHRWSFVDQNLQFVQEAAPLITVPEGDLVQIAVRTASAILVAKPAWNKMSRFQRSALFIHELVYALLPWPNDAAKSLRTRELTAYLMQPRSESRWEDWKDILSTDLPVIERLIHGQITQQRGVLLRDGAIGTELGVGDLGAYNEAFWMEPISGKKFIGFGPVLKVRFTYIDPTKPGHTILGETFPLVIAVDDPVGKFVERFLYPARAVEENESTFASLFCQVLRPGINVGKIHLSYLSYELYLEKNTSTQAIEWKLAPEPGEYFLQLSNAKTRSECEADLPLRFAEDRDARSYMKGSEN